ncbi:MAG: acyl-CoA dehydrogenase family protein [Deltaproteobacteria bacterium]|nr:acyl-CoA dehydrogenase family protein [Deltaproteobacteria bacterium]
MGFVLTEEQEAIRRAARDLMRERAPVTELRRLRDSKDAAGYLEAAWREMAGLGMVGMAIPERYGGAGLGWTELGLLLEEAGRTLAATPLMSTVVLGASAVLLGGTEAQRRELLVGVCEGRTLLALVHDEGTRHAPYAVATRAERTPGGFRLSGDKSFVLDGHVADTLIVVARTSGERGREGLTLLLVPARAPGVTITRLSMVDSRNAARVRLAGVEVSEAEVLGSVDKGADILDRVLDRGSIALSAETLGSLQEAFERTVEYLKVRKQFGVPIGSFQALKHRAAHLYCEVELSRSIVADALAALDEERPEVPLLASVAKARTSDAFLAIASEAIQLHGGIGVTDELDIGFFLKRARVAEQTLGSASHHRDRFARLRGY